MNKSELVNWLNNQNEQWEALLVQIGPDRMEQPGVCGDWSMKDLIAHLNDWQPWLLTRIQAAQRGDPAPTPPWPASLQTDDEINAWIYKNNKDRPVSEVLDTTHQLFEQLIAIIENLPDDVRIEEDWRLIYFGEKRFSVSEFFDHFRDDHEPDVRAWLARAGNS